MLTVNWNMCAYFHTWNQPHFIAQDIYNLDSIKLLHQLEV